VEDLAAADGFQSAFRVVQAREPRRWILEIPVAIWWPRMRSDAPWDAERYRK